MDLASEKPWKLMWRGTAVASAVAALAIIVLVGGGKSVISWVFGKQFIGAYAPLVVLATIPLLGVFSFPLTPMLYAFGRSDAPLRARLLGSAVFVLNIAPLSWRFGVVGAAIAFVLGFGAYVGIMVLQLKTERRLRERSM